MANEPDGAIFALDNQIHLNRCEEVRTEVDNALLEHFGRPVPMRLVVDDQSTASPPDQQPAGSLPTPSDNDEDKATDPEDLVDDETSVQQAISTLMAAFPDSELVTFDSHPASGK